MYVVIFYDITDDKLRKRVANMLKDFGLVRIQLSAFYGSISPTSLEKLRERLEKMLDREVCHIVKLCERCDKAVDQIGFAFKPIEEEVVIF